MLFNPTPIIEICGFIYCNISGFVDVFEPWCATFKISDFKTVLSFAISFSAFDSISPVNKILVFLYINLATIELLFKSSFICFACGHKI